MKIKSIEFKRSNHSAIATVGEISVDLADNMVTEITAHSAAGEGDRWFWTISFGDGTKLDVFYPLQIYWEKE